MEATEIKQAIKAREEFVCTGDEYRKATGIQLYRTSCIHTTAFGDDSWGETLGTRCGCPKTVQKVVKAKIRIVWREIGGEYFPELQNVF